MRRAVLGQASIALFVVCGTISLACATIPGFSVVPDDAASSMDASSADGASLVDGALPVDGASPVDTGSDAEKPKGYMMFVTDILVNGAIGNPNLFARDKADSICSTSAMGTPLAGRRWLAFFWESSARSPTDGWQDVEDGWHQVNPGGAAGPVAVTNIASGLQRKVNVAIHLPDGGEILSDPKVWTGGSLAESKANCNTWTSPDNGTGWVGNAVSITSDQWFSLGETKCDDVARFYCFQQP